MVQHGVLNLQDMIFLRSVKLKLISSCFPSARGPLRLAAIEAKNSGKGFLPAGGRSRRG